MTSQEAYGSFMTWLDVRDFFRSNGWLSPTSEFMCHICTIDEIDYVKSVVIMEKLLTKYPAEGEQMWRTMQSEVTTSMFGLKSIFTRDLPEVELRSPITFDPNIATDNDWFEWGFGKSID